MNSESPPSWNRKIIFTTKTEGPPVEASQQGPRFSGMLHNVDQKHVFHSLGMHFSISKIGLKFAKQNECVGVFFFIV